MVKFGDPEKLMRAAAEVLPIIRDGAEASEGAGRIGESVLGALFERRLLRLWIPREFDGEQVDLITALRVFELLSTADGAAGWTVMIGVGAGLFAGFLDRPAAAEIFLPREAVVAGSGAPAGIAREVNGGYRVSGRWAFASGAHHATWFTANCIVKDGARKGEGDAPLIRSIAVPATDVQIHQVWSVFGMRGTGSEEIEIADRFVPLSHTFSINDEPKVPGPLYRFPFGSIAELSFAAVSLGVARHALDDFKDLAAHKTPMGAKKRLIEDADVQARFARAEAAVSSARTFVFDVAQKAWEVVSLGDSVSERERARIRLAAVDAVQQCANAIDLLYGRAGMTPLFMSSTLGRAWRDLHVVTQNMTVSAGLYADAGRVLLGSE